VRGGIAFPITGTRAIGLWVSARRLTIRRKAFSGTHAFGPHRQGEAGSFDSQVNSTSASTGRKVGALTIG
jgi:hypothetical protein